MTLITNFGRLSLNVTVYVTCVNLSLLTTFEGHSRCFHDLSRGSLRSLHSVEDRTSGGSLYLNLFRSCVEPEDFS